MPTLTLDTVPNFGAQIGGDAQRIARGFFLEGIDTSIEKYEIAGYVKEYAAADDDNGIGMPAMGDGFPDSRFSELKLTNIIIEGVLPNAVAGRLMYSTPSLGFTPSVYTVTRTRQIVEHTETILPNGQRIFVDYKDSSGKVVCEDSVPMVFRRSAPVVVFEGLKAGSPDDSGGDYIGYVSADTFRGKEPGFWFLDDWTTVFSKYTGYSQFRIAIVGSILDQVYSTMGTLFNGATGKYVKVDDSDIDDARTPGYSYGIISAASGKGVVRVGGYPTVDFAGLGVPA